MQATFTMTSNLHPVGINYEALTALGIISPSIKAIFSNYEQLYRNWANFRKEFPEVSDQQSVIKEDELNEKTLRKIKRLRVLQRNTGILVVEKKFERDKINRLKRIMKSELKEIEENKVQFEKKRSKLHVSFTKEFRDCGESPYFQKCKEEFQFHNLLISNLAVEMEELKSTIKRLREQKKLLSDESSMELIEEGIYNTLPKRIPVKIEKHELKGELLTLVIEPPEEPCQYVVVGPHKPQSAETFVEFCALPGKSLQNPRELKFKIDADLWSNAGHQFPIKVVQIGEKGERTLICTVGS